MRNRPGHPSGSASSLAALLWPSLISHRDAGKGEGQPCSRQLRFRAMAVKHPTRILNQQFWRTHYYAR
jgi:hypothetical protein